MCIIAYKPKGVKLPREKILRNCFYNNKDGAGIAIQRDGKIIINKFMQAEPFFAYVRQNVRREDSVIYHFRIATHGSVELKNIHPFIITKDWQEMNETQSITTKNILAHNGIITSLVDNHKISDSKVLAHLLADRDINDNLFKSKGIRKLIDTVIDTDRLIVMNKEGKAFLLGDFEKDKGIYYSNYTFRYKKTWQYYEYQTKYATPYSGDISPYNGDISTDQSIKSAKENKMLAEADKIPVKNQPCAYCLTKKSVFYYWDIEENLCERCYHSIYEV